MINWIASLAISSSGDSMAIFQMKSIPINSSFSTYYSKEKKNYIAHQGQKIIDNYFVTSKSYFFSSIWIKAAKNKLHMRTLVFWYGTLKQNKPQKPWAISRGTKIDTQVFVLISLNPSWKFTQMSYRSCLYSTGVRWAPSSGPFLQKGK